MYEYKKRESKFKKIISLIFLIIVVAASSVFIYSMYTNIDVYSTDENNNNVAVRFSQNETKKEEQNITEVLESITKSVVGISKIKNKGNSIFLNNSASDLGLGTGMIVSENGYILTNWHVAGNKYSNCYITLENGKIPIILFFYYKFYTVYKVATCNNSPSIKPYICIKCLRVSKCFR
mgnify:CR=1 FL=1